MSQRGMLPCFLGGRVSLLFSNICRALIIFLLVFILLLLLLLILLLFLLLLLSL